MTPENIESLIDLGYIAVLMAGSVGVLWAIGR
jgi:hypothetical protein